MFVHCADKLAKMQTKFHVIQAKLIMSVWCFTVHCERHKGMATGWVSKTWQQIRFLRKCHCHWMDKSMNVFLRHGHSVGF